MGKEIERKFLVKSDSYKSQGTHSLYRQGYLSSNPECVVRIRVVCDRAYITVKSKNTGAYRMEFEYEIPLDDANNMLENLCEKPIIEKYRYKILYKGSVWEIDEFLGENEGLTVAEIELEYEDETFEKPDWVGEEVTYDSRYLNSNLIKFPYKQWQL